MRIKLFKCPHCDKEHQKKVYENVSEGTADIFTENFFAPIWEKFKDKAHEPLEKFCKELMFFTIYTYHRKRRRIHVAKDSIEQSNGIENPKH